MMIKIKVLIFFLLLSGLSFGQHYKKDGTPDRRFKENRTSSSYSVTTSNSSRHLFHIGGHKSTYSYSAPRDANGKIKRSRSSRVEFMRQTGYPHGRPGYVIDHIRPLKRGGCDCPANMQWQTKEAAKEKDKVE